MKDKKMLQMVKAQHLAVSLALRGVRKSRFMTMVQVEQVTGLSRSIVGRIERGERLIPNSPGGRRYVDWICDERYDQKP